MDHELYHQPGMRSLGRQLIEVADSFLGCHYVNGAYGAIPMADKDQNGGGLTNRPGGVVLIADATRLDPAILGKEKALAVKAATMTVKQYCVCAGRYLKAAGGSTVEAGDRELKDYLGSLAGNPASWPNFKGKLTPRRSYGPGESGTLVWGEDCTGIRHFDCITYVNYCLSQVQPLTVFSIDQWSGAPEARAVTEEEKKEKKRLQQWTAPVTGRPVFRLPNPNVQPQVGDLVVGLRENPQHIGIVAGSGTIYQAASTAAGVHADSSYDHNKWYFLVRTF